MRLLFLRSTRFVLTCRERATLQHTLHDPCHISVLYCEEKTAYHAIVMAPLSASWGRNCQLYWTQCSVTYSHHRPLKCYSRYRDLPRS